MTELHHALKTSADYQALPAKVSQLVLKQVEKTFKSYQKAQEQFKKSPSKCTGEPKLPRYKDKKKGRNVLTYNYQAISKTELVTIKRYPWGNGCGSLANSPHLCSGKLAI
jgi:hypothetical protein